MCPGPRPAVMSLGYVTAAGEKFSWQLVNKFKTLRRCCRIFLLFNSLTGWSGVTSVAHAWAGCLCCNLKKKKKKTEAHQSWHDLGRTTAADTRPRWPNLTRRSLPTLWDSTWTEATWLPPRRSLVLFSVERRERQREVFPFLPHQDCEAL